MKGIDDRMFSPTASCLLIEYGEKGWKASYCLENSQLQLLFWVCSFIFACYSCLLSAWFFSLFFKWGSGSKPIRELGIQYKQYSIQEPFRLPCYIIYGWSCLFTRILLVVILDTVPGF